MKLGASLFLILKKEFDFPGRANMVDVGSKNTTKRMARAIGIVDVGETAYKLIANNQVKR